MKQIDDRARGQRWVYIDGVECLICLVQMNALEYHVWGATVANLDRPDRVVIDLDPATGVPWARVVAGAEELRARLTALKLRSFVRLRAARVARSHTGTARHRLGQRARLRPRAF